MHLSNNPSLSWAFQKTINQIREKKRVNIRTYYPWNISDLCKSMIAIIVLLNFTPIWKIFFTCKEANVVILKGQNLSPKKLCPLDLMQENSTQKKMTMVVNIMFVVFIVSLLQENIKQTIATHFLFLQKIYTKKQKE